MASPDSNFDSQPLLFEYSGPMAPGVLRDFRQKLDARGDLAAPVRHALFSAFVEMAQNILRHASTRSTDESPRGIGRIRAAESDTTFLIQTANSCTGDQARWMAFEIERLNQLSPEQLKTERRERLHHPAEPGRPGAGLGLLDLARLAQRPIFCRLIPGCGASMVIDLSIRIGKITS